MSTKLTFNDDPEKWLPISIPFLEDHLSYVIKPCSQLSNTETKPLIKNLAYSLQYIEFLNQINIDINLTSVLWTKNVKSFLIHSAAIIEAFFSYLVVCSGNKKTTSFKSIKKVSSSTFNIGPTQYRNDIEIFEKLTSPIPTSMTFYQLSKKIEGEKLLGSTYPHY